MDYKFEILDSIKKICSDGILVRVTENFLESGAADQIVVACNSIIKALDLPAVVYTCPWTITDSNGDTVEKFSVFIRSSDLRDLPIDFM